MYLRNPANSNNGIEISLRIVSVLQPWYFVQHVSRASLVTGVFLDTGFVLSFGTLNQILDKFVFHAWECGRLHGHELIWGHNNWIE